LDRECVGRDNTAAVDTKNGGIHAGTGCTKWLHSGCLNRLQLLKVFKLAAFAATVKENFASKCLFQFVCEMQF
jgi:hypothetical protein